MNEVKEALRNVEQKYKLFQQQQFTFISALEHSRENAHSKIQPISSIEQVAPTRGRRAGAGVLGIHQMQTFCWGTRPSPLAPKMKL